jgi:hypothetical protein
VSGLSTATESQLGQVVSVYEVQAGSALAAGLAPGGTTITVDDPSDFHEDGGQLWLANVDGDITSAVVAYASVNPTTGLLTLAVPWDAAFPTFAVGDYVYVAPAATERRAEVALDGDTDQVVVTRVPWSASSQIPIGVRPAEQGEWVRVGHTVEGYVFVDAEGEYPDTDPASIVITDPDTGEEIGVIGGDAAFDTITADEVISPSVPRRNAEALTLYVDPVLGDDANDGTGFYPMVDTFERVQATSPSWGTSDSGHVWSNLQNDGVVDVGVALAGSARMRLPSASSQLDAMRSTFSPLDCEALALVQPATQAFNTSGVAWGGPTARMVDKNNYLHAAIQVDTAGVHVLRLLKAVGGTISTVGVNVTLGTFPLNTDFYLRAQFLTNPEGGTDVKAKAWLPANPEPDDWQNVGNVTDAALQNVQPVGFVYANGGSAAGQTSIGVKSLTVATIDPDGEVVDTSGATVGPFASITKALEQAGDWNDADVRLVLTGSFDEAVAINGLAGGGRLFISGGNTTTIYGVFRVYGVMHYVELRDFTLQDDGSPIVVSGSIECRTANRIELVNVKIQSNSATTSRAYNVYATEGSSLRADNCQLSGANVYCVQVAEQSQAYLNNNSGSAGTGSYRSSASIIYTDGTKPTGATATSAGGQIFGSNTTSGGGSPPPTSNKVTKTFKPNATRTWRPEWAWRTDNRDVYMGEYQGSGGLSRGCAFFGTKLNVAGKTADSGKIYVKRKSSGGASQDQAIYLCSHDLASQPSGDGGPTIKDGPTKLGTLAWGEGAWFTIPKAWVQSMLDGAGGRRGFMLYNSSASPYVICQPAGGDVMACKFTYH